MLIVVGTQNQGTLNISNVQGSLILCANDMISAKSDKDGAALKIMSVSE